MRERPQLEKLFATLIKRFQDRTIVVSYREPGIPSTDQLCTLLASYKRHVYVAKWPYSYALRKSPGRTHDSTKEVVVIGVDKIKDYSGPGREIT